MVKPPMCKKCQRLMHKHTATYVYILENGFRTDKKRKKQRYRCPECGKVITNRGKFILKHRYSIDRIGSSLDEYFDGKTWFRLEAKEKINRSTQYKWLRRHCDSLWNKMKDRLKKGNYIGHLMIDIYYIDMRFNYKKRKSENESEKTLKDYPKIYLWSCIDICTRTVIAIYISKDKSAESCKNFIKELDGFPRPKYIFSDNEPSFGTPIEEYFNKGKNRSLPRVEYLAINKSDPLQKGLHGKTNLIERYHSKIQNHISHRRRLYNLESATRYMKMFIIFYNFTVHSSLKKKNNNIDSTPANRRGISPAEKAGINIPKVSKYTMINIITDFMGFAET